MRHSLRLKLIILLIVGIVATMAGMPRQAAAQDNPVVYLQDKFKDNTNEWQVTEGAHGKIAIASGALSINTLGAEQTLVTYPSAGVPGDVDVTVTAQAVRPQINGDWFYGVGIRGRAVDSSTDFYYLRVNGFGSWEFGVSKAGKLTRIAGENLKNFKNDAATALRIIAVGNNFEFYVGDARVGSGESIQLDAVPNNRIVLIAGTNIKTTTQLVKFTDLKVVAPSGAVKAAPTSVVKAPAVLPFTETFADNSNGWGTARDDIGAIDIAGGALMIDTVKPAQLQWTHPSLTFPSDIDVTVTAQAVKPDKANSWDYGLGVRGRDVGDSSGFYYLDVFGDGSWQFVVHPKAQTTDVIAEGKLKGFKPDAANKLRVVALGSHFEIYINGASVGTADDSTLETVDANEIFLLGGTSDKTLSQLVKFTDLTVVAAKAGGENLVPTGAASVSAQLPFTEDFSNTSNPNGWNLTTDKASSITISDGALLINTKQASYFQWSNPALTFPSDVDATVTAQAVKPDRANSWYYGIGVRGREVGKGSSFYYFDVVGNGNWEFGVWMNNDWYTVVSGKLKDFKADALSTLRIVAVGSRFDLYVNGVKVVTVDEVTLETVEANQIMLLGGTYTKTYAQLVKFTNLSVVAP